MSPVTLGLDFGGSTVKIAWLRDGVVLAADVVPNQGDPADLDRVARCAAELPDGDADRGEQRLYPCGDRRARRGRHRPHPAGVRAR